MTTRTPLIILVTGVSASGKTAITGQLRDFGYDAVSLDGYPDMCGWTDTDGTPVTRPDEPDLGWLAKHDWSVFVGKQLCPGARCHLSASQLGSLGRARLAPVVDD